MGPSCRDIVSVDDAEALDGYSRKTIYIVYTVHIVQIGNWQLGYLTTGQAARRLGVGLNTIKRWIASGELSGMRTPGGHWRIAESSLAAFIERHPPRKSPGDGNPRVLIVEDDAADCALLAGAVGLAGIRAETRCVHDGYGALIRIGAWRPHLLVLDILMPGIDGLGVLRRLREDEALLGEMSIVVVTAVHDRAEVIRAVRATGVEALLPKPVEIARFQAVVRDCLARQGHPTVKPM